MPLVVDLKQADALMFEALVRLKARAAGLDYANGPAGLPDKSNWEPQFYQRPPQNEDWLFFALVTGRGTGKTDAGAHYVDQYMRANPRHRVGIIAPTLGDARATCVEGQTGLLSHNRDIHFNRSWGELSWPNGGTGQLFGAFTPEDVERLRGPQFHLVWLEEFAAWRQITGAWNMMRLALRLGSRPHGIITTTPKPRKKLLEIMRDPRTVLAVTEDGRTPTTEDNPHLHPDVRAELYRQFAGTALGRQELGGEIVMDVEGALWKRHVIERTRVNTHPDLERVVVGVDPSGGHGEANDMQGIVVMGRGKSPAGMDTVSLDDGRTLNVGSLKHGYVLDDRSCKLDPDGWGRQAVQAWVDWHADAVVVETNYGGDMAKSTIVNAGRAMGVEVPVKVVSASRGKAVRAEPVSALYSQWRVHNVSDLGVVSNGHVNGNGVTEYAEGGPLAELEDELCQWVPGSPDSPNRLDALVWAATELLVTATEVWFR